MCLCVESDLWKDTGVCNQISESLPADSWGLPELAKNSSCTGQEGSTICKMTCLVLPGMRFRVVLAHEAMIFCCSCCSSSSVSHSAALSASSILAVSSLGTGSLHTPRSCQAYCLWYWHALKAPTSPCTGFMRAIVRSPLCLPGAYWCRREDLQVRMLRLLRRLRAFGRLTCSPLGLGFPRGLEETLQAT